MIRCLSTFVLRLALGIVGIFCAAGIVTESASLAADRPLQKINVAFSSISGNMAPLWVTYEKGFFRRLSKGGAL